MVPHTNLWLLRFEALGITPQYGYFEMHLLSDLFNNTDFYHLAVEANAGSPSFSNILPSLRQQHCVNHIDNPI